MTIEVENMNPKLSFFHTVHSTNSSLEKGAQAILTKQSTGNPIAYLTHRRLLYLSPLHLGLRLFRLPSFHGHLPDISPLRHSLSLSAQ